MPTKLYTPIECLQTLSWLRTNDECCRHCRTSSHDSTSWNSEYAFTLRTWIKITSSYNCQRFFGVCSWRESLWIGFGVLNFSVLVDRVQAMLRAWGWCLPTRRVCAYLRWVPFNMCLCCPHLHLIRVYFHWNFLLPVIPYWSAGYSMFEYVMFGRRWTCWCWRVEPFWRIRLPVPCFTCLLLLDFVYTRSTFKTCAWFGTMCENVSKGTVELLLHCQKTAVTFFECRFDVRCIVVLCSLMNFCTR